MSRGWHYTQALPDEFIRCIRKLNPDLINIFLYAYSNSEKFVCRVDVWRKTLNITRADFRAAMEVGIEHNLVKKLPGKPYTFERDFGVICDITDCLLWAEEVDRKKSYPQPRLIRPGPERSDISKDQVKIINHQALLLANSTYIDQEKRKPVNRVEKARLNSQTHHIDYQTAQYRVAGEADNVKSHDGAIAQGEGQWSVAQGSGGQHGSGCSNIFGGRGQDPAD